MALKFVHLTIINVGYKVYNQCLFLRILSVGVLDLLASAMYFQTTDTSHSAYVATETELVGAKIDGLLPPNFL